MMDKEAFLKFAQIDEDKIVLSKVFDGVVLFKKYNAPRFTDFLDERLREITFHALKKAGVMYSSFGGYPDACRQMVCVGDLQGEYPLSAVAISGRGAEKLTHRDILGSVLALGIKRDKIGDIFFENERWILYAESTVAQFICQTLDRAGGVHVGCKACGLGEITPKKQEFKEIRGTVASLRLDSVTALITGTARNPAAKAIAAGMVYVNHLAQTSASYAVRDGDVISVRGFGKAKILVGGESRKGRIFVSALKYV